MKSVIGILVFASLNALAATEAPKRYLPASHDPTMNQAIAAAECPMLKAIRMKANSIAANTTVQSLRSHGNSGVDQTPRM